MVKKPDYWGAYLLLFDGHSCRNGVVPEPQNDQLNSEAFNFWLVRALYPEVSKTIEKKLQENPDAFIKQAEKAMAKQQAVSEAQAKVDDTNKQQKEANVLVN